MLKNYLTVAWRNFRKQKAFSLINVAGLAVGTACFILIMLYVQYELSFDRFHGKSLIYRKKFIRRTSPKPPSVAEIFFRRISVSSAFLGGEIFAFLPSFHLQLV